MLVWGRENAGVPLTARAIDGAFLWSDFHQTRAIPESNYVFTPDPVSLNSDSHSGRLLHLCNISTHTFAINSHWKTAK